MGFADVFLDSSFAMVPKSCKVLLLTAPERPVSMNGGMVMNSWYDIRRAEDVKLDKSKQEDV